MRKLILLAVLICSAGWTRDLLDSLALRQPSEIIKLGEKFTYRASIHASIITINQTADIFLWTDSSLYYEDSILKDSCYHFTFFTRIDPPNNYIPLIESKFESYARQKDLVTLRFERHMIEKTKEQHMIINFDLDRHKAQYEKDSTIYFNDSIVDSSGLAVMSYFPLHDFINIFYYLRLLKEFPIGDEFCIRSFAESRRKVYRLAIIVLREETVTVPAGTFDCYLLKCCVRETKLFGTGDVYLWISKDENRIIAQINQEYKAGPFWVTVVLQLKSIE